MRDRVDSIIDQWSEERPGLDVTQSAVVLRLLRAATLVEGALDSEAADHGLRNKGDLDTLAALRRAGPPFELSPGQLADVLMLTSGGMTGRIDHLEQARLVERHPDETDRRAVIVRLTSKGMAVVDEAFAANLERQRLLLDVLSTAEQRSLNDALRTLLISTGDVG